MSNLEQSLVVVFSYVSDEVIFIFLIQAFFLLCAEFCFGS